MILLYGQNDVYMPVKLLAEHAGEEKVYLCEDQKARNYVAKISEGLQTSCEAVRNFLYQTECPDIVKLKDHGLVELHGKKCFFEIFEYMPEGTWNLKAPVEAGIVAEVVIPCLNEGLHQIHEAGLLHRDIKADNIYVGREKEGRVIALIGDFGIAVPRGEDGNYCDTALSYTPGYVPVEVLGSGMYSPASDYYGLGVTIYYLLTGHQIFEGLEPEEIMMKTRRGELAHYEGVSGRMADLLEGLMIQDPRYRWGYRQVKEWSLGANVPVFRHTQEGQILDPPYGLTAQVSCHSLKELAKELARHPEAGIRHLYEGLLAEGVKKQYPYLGEGLKSLVEEQWPEKKVAGLASAIKLIDTEYAGICWNGRQYAGLDDLVLMVRKELAGGLLSPETEELLNSGVLSYYYGKNLSSEDAALLKQIEKTARTDVKEAGALLVLKLLARPVYQIGADVLIHDISEYISYLAKNRDHVQSLLVKDLNSSYFQHFLSVCGFENQFRSWHSYFYRRGKILPDSHLVGNVSQLLVEICPEQEQNLKVFVLDEIRNSPEYWMKDHLDLYEMDEMMERMVHENFDLVHLEDSMSIQALLKEQHRLKECMHELRRDLLNNYVLLEQGIYDSAGYRIIPLERDGLFVADHSGGLVPVGWLRVNQGLAGNGLIKEGYRKMQEEAVVYIEEYVDKSRNWSKECEVLCEQKRKEGQKPGFLGALFSLIMSALSMLLLYSLSQKHLENCGLITLAGFAMVFLAIILWIIGGIRRLVKVFIWNRLTASGKKLIRIGEAMQACSRNYAKEPGDTMKRPKANLETEAQAERALGSILLSGYKLRNGLLRYGLVFLAACSILSTGLVRDGALADTGADLKTRVVSLFDWDFLEGGSKSEPSRVPEKRKKFEVVVSVARMRSGPGTDHEILNVYEEGTVMTPTGKSKRAAEYTWYEVTGPDMNTGWMRSDTIERISN